MFLFKIIWNPFYPYRFPVQQSLIGACTHCGPTFATGTRSPVSQPFPSSFWRNFRCSEKGSLVKKWSNKTELLYSGRRRTNLLLCFVVFAVISSTFPIILKCSSPGNRFVIDEIIINHYNGTSVLMTSTSDALRQCNQSRRQVEGRHECRFTVNYGQIGMLSVTSVAVKYHCFKDWARHTRPCDNLTLHRVCDALGNKKQRQINIVARQDKVRHST